MTSEPVEGEPGNEVARREPISPANDGIIRGGKPKKPRTVRRFLMRRTRYIPQAFTEWQSSDPWLTTEEAAEYMRMPVQTLYKLNKITTIPYYKTGKTCLYARSDLENYIRSCDVRIKDDPVEPHKWTPDELPPVRRVDYFLEEVEPPKRMTAKGEELPEQEQDQLATG